MKLYAAALVLLIVMLFSCKKEYTQREKDRIEALRTSHVYKFKVPDESFVFCLDTIKADFEYAKLADEYCRRGLEVDSYLYLSSYKVYVPIILEYGCNPDTWWCGRRIKDLDIFINENNSWLVEDSLYGEVEKNKLELLLNNFYKRKKEFEGYNSFKIYLNVKSIKNNLKRDSLYMCLLDCYYRFIREEKLGKTLALDSLKIKYPFNLTIGEYFLPLPAPPPPIIID